MSERAAHQPIAESGAMRFRDGFDLHPIRLAAAKATPSAWRDAVVVSATEDGAIEVADVFSDDVIRLWHCDSLEGEVEIGEPVSLHPIYGVLSVRGRALSVAVR